MTPKALYPIGTQLITRRLSQAALAYELGFILEVPVSGFFFFEEKYNEWRVTVTKENQKWLSPVPIAGDLLEFKDPDSWLKSGDWDTYAMGRLFGKQVIDRFTIARPSMVEFLMREPKYRSEHPCLRKIIERTYPNGQRAPLIAFDEVILPTTGEQL